MSVFDKYEYGPRANNTYKGRARRVFKRISGLNILLIPVALIGCGLEMYSDQAFSLLICCGGMSLYEAHLLRRLNGLMDNLKDNYNRDDFYDPAEIRTKRQRKIYTDMKPSSGLKIQVKSRVKNMYSYSFVKAGLAYGTAALFYGDKSMAYGGVLLLVGLSVKQMKDLSATQWASDYLGDNKISQPKPIPRPFGYSG